MVKNTPTPAEGINLSIISLLLFAEIRSLLQPTIIVLAVTLATLGGLVALQLLKHNFKLLDASEKRRDTRWQCLF
jgi:Cu/Ag efflux pump CusA